MFSNLCLTVSENVLHLSFQKNPYLLTFWPVSLNFLNTWNLWVKWANNGSHRSIMTDWRRQTGRQSFFLRVIGSSTARVRERLADGDVIVLEVRSRPRIPGCSVHKPPWCGRRWAHNLWEGRTWQRCQGPHWRKCTGICPPHPGRWSWRAEGRTRWIREKTVRTERKNGVVEERAIRQTHQMTHEMEWVRTQTWAMRVHVNHCEKWTCEVWPSQSVVATNRSVLALSYPHHHSWGTVQELSFKNIRKMEGSARKPAVNDNLESMAIPTEFLTANPISETDVEVQGNLLRGYEQKFEELPEQEKLTKLWSNAGFSKNFEKRQFFFSLDEEGPDDLKGSCRVYTLPRSEESSHVRGWIRWNMWMWRSAIIKDVSVLRSRSNLHFETELFSWVRIVNGINKHVTETSEEITDASVENRGTGKPVAKAKPRPTPTLTLSPVSIPYLERKWIDIEPRKFSQSVFEVPKFMNRLLRNDDIIHREDGGAVRFDDLAEVFVWRFAGTSHWAIQAWISFLAKGGEQKKRFQYCLNPSFSERFLHFRAIQRHSRGTLVDPTLQDKQLLPDDFADDIYHIGNVHNVHSIIQCGLIPGRKQSQKGQAVLFFSQPWIRCIFISIKKKFNTIWINPELRYTKIRGEFTKKKFFHAIWNSLNEKDCSSIKPDHTQSIISTHNLRLVLRKWYTWRLERIETAMYTNLQGYREPYSRRICIVDVRIFLIPNREYPPTINANEVRSTRKLVARGTKKLVAVMLITEFQENLTQPSDRRL